MTDSLQNEAPPFGQALDRRSCFVAEDYSERQRSRCWSARRTPRWSAVADTEVETLIRAVVESRFPRNAFFGEEFGHNDVDGAERIPGTGGLDRRQDAAAS